MEYEDSPSDNLKFLKSLSSREFQVHVEGYLLACAHVREAFTKGKIDMLIAMMITDSPQIKSRLRKSITLLDSYEELLKSKETGLSRLPTQTTGNTVES